MLARLVIFLACAFYIIPTIWSHFSIVFYYFRIIFLSLWLTLFFWHVTISKFLFAIYFFSALDHCGSDSAAATAATPTAHRATVRFTAWAARRHTITITTCSKNRTITIGISAATGFRSSRHHLRPRTSGPPTCPFPSSTFRSTTTRTSRTVRSFIGTTKTRTCRKKVRMIDILMRFYLVSFLTVFISFIYEKKNVFFWF